MVRIGCRWQRWWWLALLATILVLPLAVQAQSQSLYWDRYDVTINVTTDGELLVEERQSITFTSGSFHFGYRTIPLDKTDGIVDLEVWEGDVRFQPSSSRNEYTFSAGQEGNELIVYWYFPYTSNSSHTYTFRYTVQGGVRMNEQEGDSIFWKAVPPDHSFPIRNSVVTVRFPSGVDLGDIVSYGTSTEKVVEEETVTFVAQREIPAGQEMEIGVAFGPGLITGAKSDWQTHDEQAGTYNLVFGAVGLLLLVGGLLGILLLWYARGRDPEVGLVAEYLSEPPSSAPPGVAGTLVDERADMQDVIASLVDLARRGYLEMVETQTSGGLFGLGSSTDFTFRRTEKDWHDLLPFERTILEKVFGSRTQRDLSDLKNKFYSAIPQIRKGLYKQTVANKYFRTDPDTVRGRYAGAGIGLLVLTAGVGFLAVSLLNQVAGAVVCPFVGVGVAAVTLIIVGQAMPVKTRHGAEETAKWKAFKRYLQDIERYAHLEEATDQFDRYLPYAIAFGIERSWINKFAAVPSTPVPIWYFPVWTSGHRTGGGLRPSSTGRGQAPSLDGMSRGMSGGLASMSAGLTSMLNTASSTLTSRPQSSGGGGWSGGGFSAGGGGGGGSAGFG